MPAQEFLILADHPALDFLNTLAQGDDGPVEYLSTNKDVIAWLQRMGYLGERGPRAFPRDVLAERARALREMIRKLLTQRKLGKNIDIGALNSFLMHGRYTVQLARASNGELEVRDHFDMDTPEQLLAPVARAAAELIATGDFDLVRKCEADYCVLWFYDRTKTHRRRWCSMALCGNRHKVAQFRQRQKNNAELE
ncbi:CGNR zinc finger domain-containing protein [Paraburkholderia caledonica]|uniref:RNA-binding Zn ribbon-like protein n=1 Tax=Paraburkholderia caledonica TaxID=134536 RepID=A0ABU1KXB1_9BURK|nr:ABATE domain-containing protein [Paraburkholderia caledonica]MDR6375577.1 putative RNA-binding Zn ribbon-like protein [Paraburkholderia caledonica]